MKKVKKRTKKKILNAKGEEYEYSTDKSGSRDSCYSYKRVQEYEFNHEGEMLKNNVGFTL